MKNTQKKIPLRNGRIKTIVLLSSLFTIISASSISAIKFSKNKTEHNQFVKNHDAALIAMNSLILLSEEMQNYYKKLNTKKKKEKIDEWYLNRASSNCDKILSSLKMLNNHKDPLIQEIMLTTESLKDFFEQAAKLTAEGKIILTTFDITRTIDSASLTRVKMGVMENEKNKQKSMQSLQNISSLFFHQNIQYLDESEKDVLSSQIYSKFKESIDKYTKECEKTQDHSQILMYDFEWGPIYMYSSINT